MSRVKPRLLCCREPFAFSDEGTSLCTESHEPGEEIVASHLYQVQPRCAILDALIGMIVRTAV